MPEGKPLRFIEWGTGGPCERNLWVGFVENPTGGGPPTGKVQGLASYECGVEVVDEALPWSLEVTEPQPSVFRMRIGNGAKAPGAVFLRIRSGVQNVQYFGEVAPKLLHNGHSIGASPTEEEFDQPGSGELMSEGFGGLKFAGKLKSEGYAAQELIEVKNP